KTALKKADDELAKNRRPPGVTTGKDEGPTGPAAADVAAAAAIPPLGVGEGLIAELAINRMPPKPAVAKIRWVKLDDRLTRILNLDPTAKTDPKRKAMYDAAAAARAKNEPYEYDRKGFPNWQIYSREIGQTVDFFILVHQPGEDMLVTERELAAVKKQPPT